ncbi:MAG: Holliday junction branch migration protein RuvA [bacterium]|nr:Holliday junction branch migration protein RuvA [bacterium]
MIAYLRGTLLEKHPNQVIVDAGGVGYDVMVPVSTFSSLPGAGVEVRLHIHTHVREDALALFGFASPDEKTVFERLITVSGIGPRLAISILSGLSTPDLVTAIRGGAVDHLVRIPGVGKKTAERMVVELRDKLEGLAGSEAPPAAEEPEKLSTVEQDVLSALLNLGCSRPAAEKAVRKAKAAGTPEEFEPLFRRAMENVR